MNLSYLPILYMLVRRILFVRSMLVFYFLGSRGRNGIAARRRRRRTRRNGNGNPRKYRAVVGVLLVVLVLVTSILCIRLLLFSVLLPSVAFSADRDAAAGLCIHRGNTACGTASAVA